MNGPDHYREAEGFIRNAQDTGSTNPGEERVHLAYAQVHATLALAAATALRTGSDYYNAVDDVEAWAEATDAAVVRDKVGPTMPGHPCSNSTCCAVDGYQLVGNRHDQNGGAS